MTRFLASLAVVAGVAAASPARAQSDGDERARLHFESGRSYFEEGAYERALVEFERAYELSPRTAMLFNLGTTYERLARYGEAADAFERYANESPDLPNRATLLRRVENLRRRAAAQEANEPDPGPDPDVETETEAETQTGSTSTSTAPPSETTSSGGGGGAGLIIGGAVGLGVAGVGLVMTAIFGGLTLAEQSSVEDGCYATGPCTDDEISTLRTFATVTDVGWITAAVAGTAGVILLALGIASGSDDSQAAIRFNGTGVEGSF